MRKKILLLILIVSSMFFFMPNFFASAEDLTFTLDTHGYTGGSWVNQNVQVDIIYNGTSNVEYEMSVGHLNNWQNFSGSHTFDQNFNNVVYFRIITLISYSDIQALQIKVDKICPTIDMVISSTTLPTNQDITLTIVATDEGSNVVGYKLGDMAWQASNVFTIVSNVTYEAGQLLIKDSAGNQTAHNNDIVIANIDKNEPIFSVTADTENNQSSQLVTFYVNPIASGIKQFLVIAPNGKQYDITQTYQNGYFANQNGEYVFVITSNAGNTTSIGIIFSNITGFLATWQKIIVFFVLAVIGTISLIGSLTLRVKRLSNKK